MRFPSCLPHVDSPDASPRYVLFICPEKPEPRFGHMPKPDPYAEVKSKGKYFFAE